MIHFKQETDSFLVSNFFVDNFLCETNGSFVKVYLYVLRHINNCNLEIAGKSAPTFYDLRVGESVSITLEGETIVKLVTNATDGVTQINGVVTSVNVSRNLIQVNYIDSASGVSVIEPVFVKSKATIIDILTGSTMKLASVKEGSKITAFGIRTGGIFEATTINVSN